MSETNLFTSCVFSKYFVPSTSTLFNDLTTQYLPYLWKYKLAGGTVMFLSREGAVLESPELAVSFISRSSGYSGEDERRVEHVVSTLDLAQDTSTSTQPAPANSAQASDYGEDSRCAADFSC